MDDLAIDKTAQAQQPPLEPLPSEPRQSYFEISESVILKKNEALQAFQQIPKVSTADYQFYKSLLELATEYYLLDQSQSEITLPYSTLQASLKAKSLPSTRQTIMKRAKALAKQGVFLTMRVEPRTAPERRKTGDFGGGRSLKRYICEAIYLKSFIQEKQAEFKANSLVQGRTITRRVDSSSKKIVDVLAHSGVQFINSFAMLNQPKTDNFFTGVLDRSMRFDTKEEVPDGVIINSIDLGNARLTIQAESSSRESSEIAVLADQRIIRAIVTEIIRVIEDKLAELKRNRIITKFKRPDPVDISMDANGAPVYEDHADYMSELVAHIHNNFYVDTVRIADRLGYTSPSSGKTRSLINQGIRRLYETNFRVVMETASPSAAEHMRQRFGLEDNVMDFRFITDLKSQHEPEFCPEGVDLGEYQQQSLLAEQYDPNHTPTREELKRLVDPFNESQLTRIRVWRIAIDSHLFYRLLDKDARNTFLAHEEILEERSGLAQTLYNVLSSRIGRTSETSRNLQTSLKNLHDVLWPERRFERFEEHFINLMKRHSKYPEAFATAVQNANKARRKAPFTPQTVIMFGFVFVLSIHNQQWWLSVERDKNDPISGDKSAHNRLRQKEQADKQRQAFR